MPDAYDVRFVNEWMRSTARQVGHSMNLPAEHGPESTDPRIRLAHALDDNEHLKQRLREALQEREELRTLLRSALWELARANQAKVPQVWAAEWYRTRKRMV